MDVSLFYPLLMLFVPFLCLDADHEALGEHRWKEPRPRITCKELPTDKNYFLRTLPEREIAYYCV